MTKKDKAKTISIHAYRHALPHSVGSSLPSTHQSTGTAHAQPYLADVEKSVLVCAECLG